MTYSEAMEWIGANKSLIGTKTERGILIGDLLAVPVNKEKRDALMREYTLNRSHEVTLILDASEECEVLAIDTFRLDTAGIIFYKIVAE